MLKKILNTVSSQLLGSVINLFTFIMISNIGEVGIPLRGEAGLILSTITIVLLGINIISGASLVYLFPRVHKGTLIYISYLWALLLSGIAYIILLIVNQYTTFIPDLIIHVCLLTFLNSIFNTNLGVLISEQKIVKNNYLKAGSSFIILVFVSACIFLLNFTNSFTYVYALYLAYSAVFLISLFFIKKHLGSIDRKSVKEIIRKAFFYGILNQSAHIVFFINSRLGYFLLYNPLNANDIALGNYTNAISICEAIWIVTRSVSLVQYSKIVNSDNHKYNVELSFNLAKWSFILCSIGLIPLLLLPNAFYTSIFSKNAFLMHDIIQLLAPSIVLYNFASVLGHFYSGNGKYQVNLYGALIGFIITCSSVFYMASHYAYKGIALVFSISLTGTSIFILIYFMKDNNLKFNFLIPKKSDLKQLFPSKKQTEQY